MTNRSTLLAITALLATQSVQAYQTCWNGRYYYRCNRLSTGARIAIGVCVAVGVILLIIATSMFRRRRMNSQMSKYQPPPLPVVNPHSSGPYANNPPPPPGMQGMDSPYGRTADGVSQPQNSYQPPGQPPVSSGAGAAASYYGTDKTGAGQTGNYGNNLETHDYEYEQARLDAEARHEAPPGYSVGGSYAPPSGPPPAAGNATYSAPSGPPPGRRDGEV